MIWITQWKCPDNHAIAAVPWDDAVTTAEETRLVGEELLTGMALNRRCGICGSEDITPQAGRTRFATVADAAAAMARSQAEQLESRRLLDALGMTKEPLQ